MINSVIIYPRKSRDDIKREMETGEDILTAMTNLLIATCDRLNIPNREILPEIGSADTIEGRPVFSRIIYELLPSGKYQGIVVREISRLGRGNFTDAGTIYDAIIDYKIYIVTPQKTYDPTNKMDLKMLRWELFQAREEYESIKDRLWTYRDARAQQGFASGGPCTLGYGSIRGKFFIIPEEAEIVKSIFQMRAEGVSYREIASILNSSHKRPRKGGKFGKSTITKIIHNKKYIGISEWMGREYPGQTPPIIPVELWNKVHKEVNPSQSHRPVVPRDNDYLVELYCHECGSRMYGNSDISSRVLVDGTKRIYKSKLVYVCEERKRFHVCNNRQKSADMVHKTVFEELEKVVLNKNLVRDIMANHEKTLSQNIGNLQASLISKQKIIKQKESFIAKVKKDYAEGDLSAALYSEHREQTEKELDALNAECQKLQTLIRKTSEVTINPKLMVNTIRDKLKQWDYLENRAKKALIKAFFTRIEISSSDEFFITRSLPHSLDF